MNPVQVVVHPLVLLSVTDHYNRSAKNTKKRVVGVLLGQVIGDTVNVANRFNLVFITGYKIYSFQVTVSAKSGTSQLTSSYAVPFEEDEKDPSVWFLDHNYHEAMYDMFRIDMFLTIDLS